MVLEGGVFGTDIDAIIASLLPFIRLRKYAVFGPLRALFRRSAEFFEVCT